MASDILIVDDEAVFARWFAGILEDDGTGRVSPGIPMRR